MPKPRSLIRAVRDRLDRAGPVAFSIYGGAAAFAAYFCMYAFRKPFTAGEFGDASLAGIGYKSVLISAQVAGYTLSKFIGIKVVSEMPPRRRALAIIALIGVAELALVGFALIPAPYNFLLLFINGLPLGMIFGLVLSFLEGRRSTELLSAALCASFIVSSGVVKSIGRSMVLDWGVNEYWMPSAVGLIFFPPLLAAVGALALLPEPNEADITARARRMPMSGADRRRFLQDHWILLSTLVFVYVVLTLLRSLRDDFAVEIWADLGRASATTVFAKTEFIVMLVVLAICAATYKVKDNRNALSLSLWLVLGGMVLSLAATAGQAAGALSPLPFMVLLGAGLYVPYVIYQTTLFERWLATLGGAANLGFVIYLADSLGYLGYVGLMFAKPAISESESFLELLNSGVCWGAAASCLAVAYLLRKEQPRRKTATASIAKTPSSLSQEMPSPSNRHVRKR